MHKARNPPPIHGNRPCNAVGSVCRSVSPSQVGTIATVVTQEWAIPPLRVRQETLLITCPLWRGKPGPISVRTRRVAQARCHGDDRT